MPQRRNSDRAPITNRWTWLVLWSIALAIHLSAAFLLPNAEQDGYSYAENIARLSANFGHLRLTDLYGFWLPLFQVTAAILNGWIDNPLLAGKILSALCGAVSCVLVFAITEKLTRNILLAAAVFALVVLNPLHILYSAACMTDVPHACLVLASLWFLLRERWLAAAVFAAVAESIRIESWSLIVLLPMLQFLRQRRVSPLLIAIVLFPPLAWFLISHFATGDAFAYFAERARYHANYLDFYPTRRGFAWADIEHDADYFLLGANRIVFFGILFASGVLVFQVIRRPHRVFWPALFVAGYAVALLTFVVLAYVTKRQPVLLPRYALVFFLLGLPLVAWLLQLLLVYSKPAWLAKCATVAVIGVCFLNSKRQMPIVSKVRDDFRAHSQIADAVANASQQPSDNQSRCFSDDVAVRVLSHLPPERFVRSQIAPASAWDTVENFESYLRAQRVAYLVFMPVEDSLPAKFFPELSQNKDLGIFQFVTGASSSFGPDVSLYRVRDDR